MTLRGDITTWRWIAALLATLMVTNFGTAVTLRTSEADIESVMERCFTDISDSYGMYDREGRPRLKMLESEMRERQKVNSETNERLARIEQSLKLLTNVK